MPNQSSAVAIRERDEVAEVRRFAPPAIVDERTRLLWDRLFFKDAEPAEVAEVIEALWGGPETLIVVSSDLSHYLGYAQANAIDRKTCDAVLALDTDIDHEQACGATPVAGLALTAQRKNLRPELLDRRNSGDTAGDKHRVVGYASFAFYER